MLIAENGCSVLDVGCNKGVLVFQLATLFPNACVVGIDPWSEVIDEARAQAADADLSNISFQVEDAARLPAEWTSKFDLVISVNTLHHLTDPVKACKEMHRVLSPNGYFQQLIRRAMETCQSSFRALMPLCSLLFACLDQRQAERSSCRLTMLSKHRLQACHQRINLQIQQCISKLT